MDRNWLNCFYDPDRCIFCQIIYEQTNITGKKKLGANAIVFTYLHWNSIYHYQSQYWLLVAGTCSCFCIYWMCFLLSANKMDSDGVAMVDGRFCNLYAVFQKIKTRNV